MRTLTSLFCALVVTTTCLALPPQLIYNNVDTNAIGTAPDGYVLTEQNLKPVWAPNAGGGGGGGTNVTINFYTVITTNIFSISNVSFVSITTNLFVTTNVSTYITNFTLVTTNVTIEQPGGFTNLNLIPGTVMVTDTNDAESSLPNGVGVLTNNGVNFGWSRSLILDEIDVGTGYFSNSFFFHTNWPFIGLDGNGQIFQSDNPTNNDLSISNALYLQIAGGTNSVLPPNALGALTNNASGGLGWYNLLALLSLATNNDTLVSNALYLTFNSGTNNLLPPNALGALTNNGSGVDGWYNLRTLLALATNSDQLFGANATNNDTLLANNIKDLRYLTNVWNNGPTGTVSIASSDPYDLNYASFTACSITGITGRSNAHTGDILLSLYNLAATNWNLTLGGTILDASGLSALTVPVGGSALLWLRYTPQGPKTNSVFRAYPTTALTINTLVVVDSNGNVVSLANGTGALTNNGSGVVGWYGNFTAQGNTFNGASQLVQLDGSTKMPAVDGSQLTNLTINYDTNAIPSTGVLTFGHSYDTNLQADITLPAFTLNPNKYETLVLGATNSSAAVHTITMPAGVRVAIANGGGNKFYCTNANITEIVVSHDGLKWTNSFKNEF